MLAMYGESAWPGPKDDVDNAEVLKTVKKGDTIEATVYEGDVKLYKVRVVKPDPKK